MAAIHNNAYQVAIMASINNKSQTIGYQEPITGQRGRDLTHHRQSSLTLREGTGVGVASLPAPGPALQVYFPASVPELLLYFSAPGPALILYFLLLFLS